jgi:hypothetical protein
MYQQKSSSNPQFFAVKHKLLLGDWLVMIMSLAVIFWMFQTFWHASPAAKVQVRLANQVVGTYSLNQQREIHVHGPLGESVIAIRDGQARFLKSPCTGQYCVHHGWLKRAGQVAICLPNQVSLTLQNAQPNYDSLNY